MKNFGFIVMDEYIFKLDNLNYINKDNEHRQLTFRYNENVQFVRYFRDKEKMEEDFEKIKKLINNKEQP
jgi:hypothetical protein